MPFSSEPASIASSFDPSRGAVRLSIPLISSPLLLSPLPLLIFLSWQIILLLLSPHSTACLMPTLLSALKGLPLRWLSPIVLHWDLSTRIRRMFLKSEKILEEEIAATSVYSLLFFSCRYALPLSLLLLLLVFLLPLLFALLLLLVLLLVSAFVFVLAILRQLLVLVLVLLLLLQSMFSCIVSPLSSSISSWSESGICPTDSGPRSGPNSPLGMCWWRTISRPKALSMTQDEKEEMEEEGIEEEDEEGKGVCCCDGEKECVLGDPLSGIL